MSGTGAAVVRRLPSRLADQLARAQELNPQINAFTHLYPARGEFLSAGGVSRKLDQRRTDDGHLTEAGAQEESTAQPGVLRGVSVGVKDLFATADDAPTTCASRTLRGEYLERIFCHIDCAA